MRGTCKKLVTDIQRDADIEKDLPEYIRLMKGQFNLYATTKMCMNYYTMKEMLQDHSTAPCCRAYFDTITGLVKKHIIDREAVSSDSITTIRDIRRQIEQKMTILTSYTDGFEVYEYMLNRVEAGILGTVEDVDTEQLSAKLYNYVFMENDTVLINSKLQLIMAQLPVRMTKMKFFDIVARTLAIYTGSEKSTVDEFADMLKSTALLKTPEGFETEYKELYALYGRLKDTDFKNLSKDEFGNIETDLSRAAQIVNNDTSVYMLMQEIVNDVYAILLTVDAVYEDNLSAGGYSSAVKILSECVAADKIEDLPEYLLAKFIDLEGVQETVYENIMILMAAYDDIAMGKAEKIDGLGIRNEFDALSVIDKLLSTSLFIDIDKEDKGETELADSVYINELKEQLISDFTALFKGIGKQHMRSVMCKLLSAMPVFMNNKQEIKDYFDYVLTNCNDESELTACSKLLNEMMDEEQLS